MSKENENVKEANVFELESILGMKTEKATKDDTKQKNVFVPKDDYPFKIIFLTEMRKGMIKVENDKNVPLFAFVGLIFDAEQKIKWEKRVLSFLSKEVSDSIISHQPLYNKGFRMETSTPAEYKRSIKISEMDSKDVKEVLEGYKTKN